MDQEGLSAGRSEGSPPDFAIHGAIFDAASKSRRFPRPFSRGHSFKMFMTYAKLKWMTDDYHLTWAMDLIAENGGLAMVHAESGWSLITSRINPSGEGDQKEFSSNPARLPGSGSGVPAVSIAAVMRCPLYVAHLSSGRGVLPIRQAREEGQWLYAEPAPSTQPYRRNSPENRTAGQNRPPLRYEKGSNGLWQAIQNGTIDTIASDHAPKAKKMTDPFFEAPFGAPRRKPSDRRV